MEDGSQLSSIGALAWAVEGSADVELTVLGYKSGPSASGKNGRFAINSGPIRAPVDKDVPIFNGGDGSLWDVPHDMVLVLSGPTRSMTQKGVLVWDVIAEFINPWVVIAYSAVQHTWGLNDSFDPDRTIGVLGSGFVDRFGDPGDTWLPNVVIMVAVPHNVPRGGSGTFA